MANIPGITSAINPGTFSRDRIRTTGVALPGGTRVLAILGEGRREETLISSAAGGGKDGLSSNFSGTANPDGRHFSLSQAPAVVNRTTLLLNGIPLNGIEAQITSLPFDSRFDYRIDSSLGHIELQGASIVNQGGKDYIRGASNYGDGSLALLEVVSQNAPAENWTIRTAGVSRDAYGRPVSETETFTLTGTVSGQIRTTTGSPIVFSVDAYGVDGYYDVDYTFIGLNPITTQVDRNDGYFAVPDNGSSIGYSIMGVAGTTNLVYSPAGGFLQAAPGDTVKVSVLGVPASTYTALVTVVHNDKVVETDTPIFVSTSNLLAMNGTGGFTFTITAPKVLHTSSATWNATVLGKKIRSPFGDYAVIGLIQEEFYGSAIHTLRLTGSLSSSVGPGIQWQTLQTNTLINFAIMEGLQAFDIGDRFDFVVFSRRLNQNDSLVAQYIAVADINAPTYFTEVQDVYNKHGRPALDNTLSLGAQLAFTNGAPGIMCVGAAPGLARRTGAALLSVTDGVSAGQGFNGSTTSPTVDSLRLPLPAGALPDGTTDVHIFVDHRDAASGTVTARQIFPNKVPFYESVNAGPVGENNFVTNNTYSYTLVLDHTVLSFGQAGTTDKTKPFNFAASDAQFSSVDKSNALGVGNVVRLVGGAKADGSRFTSFNDPTILSSTDLSNGIVAADGSIALRVANVLSSTTVVFAGLPIDLTTSAPFAVISGGTFGGFLQNLQSVDWQLIDASQNVVLTASVLFSQDIVTNGTIQQGDGVRISYVDQKDAAFFDPNWLFAYESLEAFDVQMVCPLPTTTFSSIFRQGVTHCESQSYIQNKHERVLLIGAITGITPDALLGNTKVAVEDIGIIEGIQGASAADVLDGNIEDLADYSINTNFGNTNRVEYFFPDQIVVNVAGELTALNGFYLAPAAGGWYANNQNIADPLTNKSLSGFTILSSRQYKPKVLNQLAGIGVTVLQPITGGGNVLWGKSTSNSGYIEDQEISIRFIRDRVQVTMRNGMQGLVGTPETPGTASIMVTRAVRIMTALVSQGIITSFQGVSVSRDLVVPTQWNVFASYSPTAAINWIFVDLEVGIS
jgi:hypothetical protein